MRDNIGVVEAANRICPQISRGASPPSSRCYAIYTKHTVSLRNPCNIHHPTRPLQPIHSRYSMSKNHTISVCTKHTVSLRNPCNIHHPTRPLQPIHSRYSMSKNHTISVSISTKHTVRYASLQHTSPYSTSATNTFSLLNVQKSYHFSIQSPQNTPYRYAIPATYITLLDLCNQYILATQCPKIIPFQYAISTKHTVSLRSPCNIHHPTRPLQPIHSRYSMSTCADWMAGSGLQTVIVIGG
ncbi:hypothetical protein J6590_038511 [Homalodisca vitripennis]|nr:hypothetical protein J6590_038511 [Homalodisca vitripennis]